MDSASVFGQQEDDVVVVSSSMSQQSPMCVWNPRTGVQILAFKENQCSKNGVDVKFSSCAFRSEFEQVLRSCLGIWMDTWPLGKDTLLLPSRTNHCCISGAGTRYCCSSVWIEFNAHRIKFYSSALPLSD